MHIIIYIFCKSNQAVVEIEMLSIKECVSIIITTNMVVFIAVIPSIIDPV